jgi:hypothetical protein
MAETAGGNVVGLLLGGNGTALTPHPDEEHRLKAMRLDG